MELRVGGNELLLCLDRAYVSDDETALLQQVARFKPLVDYLTTFKPSDFTLSVYTVANVGFVASRVSSVSGHITLKHSATKELLTQPLTLSDDASVVVLPMITVGTNHYAVLVERARVAVGGEKVAEAFSGSFGKDGAFVTECGELLNALGFQITEKTCTALANDEMVLGQEGNKPLRIVRASRTFTQESYDDAMRSAIATDDAKLVVVPLADVAATSTDMKAVLAASLALAGARH